VGKKDSKSREGLFMITGIASVILSIVVLGVYLSSDQLRDGGFSYSSFSRYIDEQMTKRSIHSVSKEITEVRCKLPENRYRAMCQLEESYIQSLWSGVTKNKQNKNTSSSSTMFSLNREEDISNEYRAKLNGEIRQLRQEEMELKSRLLDLKKQDS